MAGYHNITVQKLNNNISIYDTLTVTTRTFSGGTCDRIGLR